MTIPAGLPVADSSVDAVSFCCYPGQNNVAADYSDNDRQKIVSAAQDALEAISEARYATTRGRAIQRWQDVLGPSFRG